jgi:alkanesulfonate monooxygenase SsuD/methylene tetrahydromethanopterin reductase-like flavin-dependent oxidoreductase (luciferase family)
LDGKHPSVGDALETFSILGVVTGATERLRLVTSVLVLPYRNPVLTPKMVASLDVLSGGRITLGVGAGWLKEEFEALNSPAFNARGAVTDEWITIFKMPLTWPRVEPRLLSDLLTWSRVGLWSRSCPFHNDGIEILTSIGSRSPWSFRGGQSSQRSVARTAGGDDESDHQPDLPLARR